MDAQTYPSQGLTLPQLVFAMKQELSRTAYAPSYVTQVHCGLHYEALEIDFLTSSVAIASTRFLNWTRILPPS